VSGPRPTPPPPLRPCPGPPPAAPPAPLDPGPFASPAATDDAAVAERTFNFGREQLGVVQRSVSLQHLYGRRQKSVIELVAAN